MRTTLFAVLGVALALCSITIPAQSTLADRRVELVIESRTLAGALDQWAQQTGINLVSPDWSTAEKITARTLKGTFRAQEALDRLLEGTPLTYVWLDGQKMVRIHERAAKSKNARSRLGASHSSVLGATELPDEHAPPSRAFAWRISSA